MATEITRVLIIEENSWVPIDRRVWDEATSLRDAGCEVTVICPSPMGVRGATGAHAHNWRSEERVEGIAVHRFALRFAEKGFAAYLREYLTAFVEISRLTWKVWRQVGFDVLHLCNPPDLYFPICLACRIMGVRIVFDHHDLFPEMVLARYRGAGGRMLYWLARLGELLTMRSAHVVIEPNESYRKIAQTRGRRRPEQVVVVRNGPRANEFDPVESVPELRRGFPYMVCYVGVMGQEDGVMEMVAIIDKIVSDLERHDILFTLVGDGSCRSRAQAELAARGLEPYVDMPGMVRDDLRLRQYMSTADVLVSPEPSTPLNVRSTFVKIGEYMAIGKPIVASDLPETRYTAQDAACYVIPGDAQAFAEAIVELLDDPVRCRLMGSRGQQKVAAELIWERQVPGLLRAYGLN
jgi:glycosyltransferase involved in cell wall biosynthesis